MTAFVILAAGRGDRIGGDLHKALLPLAGKAVISHQMDLAPRGARIIICTGYRAGQVRDYAALAHPGREITFVPVQGWDRHGGGPGASLLAARAAVGDDDLIFTSCDTLWTGNGLWDAGTSWAGVAAAPGTWCRISSDFNLAYAIRDKAGGPGDAYTGLSMIMRRDLPAFWEGIGNAPLLAGERQVTGGLEALIGRLAVRRIEWTDTGDKAAYARAVTAWSGYDWSKPGEATYVLPGEGRVIKFRQGAGQSRIAAVTPKLIDRRPDMTAWEYVPGVTGYEAAEHDTGLVPRLLAWASGRLWRPARARDTVAACDEFYRVKTHARLGMLPDPLRGPAAAALARVDWDELRAGCEPVTFHGDFNLGNIIVTPGGGFTAIDWRDSFAGRAAWGDRRYDLAKLAAGMHVHWGNARRGNFAPWPAGRVHLEALAGWLGGSIPHDVQVIAALSLLNCAPLHAPPLDAVLAERGTALLEGLL